MSDTVISCPVCQSRLRLPAHLAAGSHGQCPKCGGTFVIPAVPSPDDPAPAPPGHYTDLPRAPSTRESDEPGEYREDDPASVFARALQAPLHRHGIHHLSGNYRIDLPAWFRYASSHYSAVLGPMIAYLLIYTLIEIGVSNVPCLSLLAALFVSPVLDAGLTIVALAQLKGNRWSFGDFFSGFNWWWPLVGANLLAGLIVTLLLVPGGVLLVVADAERDEALLGIALAVLVPGMLTAVYLLTRLCFFADCLIVDRRCGPAEALAGSWQLSQGHFWGLFGVSILLGLIQLAGVGFFCVGLLLAMPLIRLVRSAGYLLVTAALEPQESAKPYTFHEPS